MKPRKNYRAGTGLEFTTIQIEKRLHTKLVNLTSKKKSYLNYIAGKVIEAGLAIVEKEIKL